MEKDNIKTQTRKPQPLDNIVWRKRDSLLPNDYNPNSVAPPEIQLLKISILEDGWTQPIVINPDLTIVDGFHRWTVSGHKEIFELTDGYVPTVMTNPKDRASQQMATIRHNRARGTHGVLNMAQIVGEMIQEGLSMEEISTRLQMEEEEIVRLANRQGIYKSDLVKDKGFSNAWRPK